MTLNSGAAAPPAGAWTPFINLHGDVLWQLGGCAGVSAWSLYLFVGLALNYVKSACSLSSPCSCSFVFILQADRLGRFEPLFGQRLCLSPFVPLGFCFSHWICVCGSEPVVTVSGRFTF